MGTLSHAGSDRSSTPASDTPTSVYRYYDQYGVLLYVGVTSRGIQRNREHNTTKEWWPYVVNQDVDHYPSRAAALDREKMLINRCLPPFNVQGNPEHSVLRAAYLGLSLEDPTAVKGRREIPLVYMYDHGRYSFYRTELADYGFAQRLRHVNAPVLHGGSKTRIGFVCGVDFRGAVALVRVRVDPPHRLMTSGLLTFCAEGKDRTGLLRIHLVRLSSGGAGRSS